MAEFSAEASEREAVRLAANLMAASARTAPKTRGIDNLKTLVIDGDDVKVLAEAMEAKAKTEAESLAGIFVRDAANVRRSWAVVLIGVSRKPKKLEQPFDCGSCGYESCEKMLRAGMRRGKDFNGPVCAFQAIDLGVALGSAVKLASDLNIDNRMMYTIGAAAQQTGLLEADIIVGIPLAVTGKNIYFDRHETTAGR